MRSSRAAVDLIVRNEVSSKDIYDRKYQRPEWPGLQSGITIGIGYDLGYNTAADILHDWATHLAPDVIRAMQKYAGLKGAAAHAALAEARAEIIVPWDAAMAVFMSVTLPKFEATALRACPGSEKLPAGCFGVLSSVVYNRGAGGFSNPNSRYTEMRNIRAHILTGRWDLVPGELRAMKRLWENPPVVGLLRRRDEEAALWQASLHAAPQPVDDAPGRTDSGDERDEDAVTPEGNHINVQPSHGVYSLEVELIQRKLIDMKYFEVGDPDGKIGGKFVAGVAAFMTDRGKDPNRGQLTPELKAEIAKASAERLPDGTPWTRPISPTRANATAKDIAPKVASVNANWYQKLIAWVMGLPALVGAGVKALFGNDPSSYIGQVKDVLASIPTEFWLLGVAGLAAAVYFAAKVAQDATVKDYNEGKIN